MSKASRFFMAQDQKNRDRQNLGNARSAVERFRKHGNPSGFPELELWVTRHGLTCPELGLSGFGREDKWQLTQEEYDHMKAVYKSLRSNYTLEDE